MNKNMILYQASVFFSSLANFIIAPSIILYIYKNYPYNELDTSYLVSSKMVICLTLTFFISYTLYKLPSKKLMLCGQLFRVFSIPCVYFFENIGILIFFILFSVGSVFYRSASKSYLSEISTSKNVFKVRLNHRIKIQNIATVIGPMIVLYDNFNYGFLIKFTIVLSSIVSLICIFLLKKSERLIEDAHSTQNKKNIEIKMILLPILASLSFNYPLSQLDYLIPTSLKIIHMQILLPVFFLCQSALVIIFQKTILTFFDKMGIGHKTKFSLPTISFIFLFLFLNTSNIFFFVAFCVFFSIMEVIVSPEVDMIISNIKINSNQAFFYISGLSSLFIIFFNTIFGEIFTIEYDNQLISIFALGITIIIFISTIYLLTLNERKGNHEIA